MKGLPILLSTAYRPASTLARKSNFFRQIKIAIFISLTAYSHALATRVICISGFYHSF